MPLKIAAFPKCYIDQIAGDRSMSVFDWIEMARSLDADGLEMYDGFFTSLEPSYLDSGRRGHRRGGLRHADALLLARFHEPRSRCTKASRRPRSGVDRGRPPTGRPAHRLPGALRPAIPGYQPRARGSSGSSNASARCLPAAREHDIVLGLENHYKDGFWKYPEFAQKMDVFLEAGGCDLRPRPFRSAI